MLGELTYRSGLIGQPLSTILLVCKGAETGVSFDHLQAVAESHMFGGSGVKVLWVQDIERYVCVGNFVKRPSAVDIERMIETLTSQGDL